MTELGNGYRVFVDRAALSRAAARAFVEASQLASEARGRFTVALAGGNTPKRLYELLAGTFRDDIPWNDVHVFWSDERFVSREDDDSNYGMVRDVLLDAVPLPHANVHAPDVDTDDVHASAERYEQTIREVFAPDEPRFDWMLLGLGEDGHIASLFPGAPALDEDRRLVVAVTESPKPPPVRLTMTLPLINRAREVHFLVSGASKHDALLRSREDGAEVPAQRVRRDGTFWWVDGAAADPED